MPSSLSKFINYPKQYSGGLSSEKGNTNQTKLATLLLLDFEYDYNFKHINFDLEISNNDEVHIYEFKNVDLIGKNPKKQLVDIIKSKILNKLIDQNSTQHKALFNYLENDDNFKFIIFFIGNKEVDKNTLEEVLTSIKTDINEITNNKQISLFNEEHNEEYLVNLKKLSNSLELKFFMFNELEFRKALKKSNFSKKYSLSIPNSMIPTIENFIKWIFDFALSTLEEEFEKIGGIKKGRDFYSKKDFYTFLENCCFCKKCLVSSNDIHNFIYNSPEDNKNPKENLIFEIIMNNFSTPIECLYFDKSSNLNYFKKYNTDFIKELKDNGITEEEFLDYVRKLRNE